MTTLTDLHEKVQGLLTEVANRVARESGFIRRKRQITGEGFIQALVLGGLEEPNATRHQQQQHAVRAAQIISSQGLEQRIEQASAVRFLEQMVRETLKVLVSSEEPRGIFPMFKGVYVTDCTRLEWPDRSQKAGVRLELQHGQMEVTLMEVHTNDQQAEVIARPLPASALHLADLGFFKVERFRRWSEQQVYWLTRYKVGTTLYHAAGHRLDLKSLLQEASGPLQMPVQVGAGRLPAYLLAAPLPPDALAKRQARLKEQARLDQKPLSQAQLDLASWTLYLTNIPALTFSQAQVLARIRWQIELLFKLWKSHAKLLVSRSTLPIRQQVEGLAKFIGVILSHWFLLTTGWHYDALSPLDALRLLRTHIPALWRALPDVAAFVRVLGVLAAELARLSASSSRRQQPAAFQLWRQFDYAFP